MKEYTPIWIQRVCYKEYYLYNFQWYSSRFINEDKKTTNKKTEKSHLSYQSGKFYLH
jgi:hypothetical protein